MNYTSATLLAIIFMFLFGCQQATELVNHAQHYQKHNDYFSLNKVVELLPEGADTTLVQSLLGEPIDMGFDYRYLIDSTGPNGCVIGAVFHINDEGRIDQKWVDEICE